MINNCTISKTELIKLGYREHTAISIIRQAKQIMVKQGYAFYNNKRLGRVPKSVVENILGISIQVNNTSEGNSNGTN
ncbi:hypothetical protein HMPREF0433_00631 [Gemella sanguinis M325]|jgi:hypothetical protein bcoam_03439|uniref:DUF3173 domain-containing protein n=1 Tax=Gemella sanguinis TaxID=84135 RepID=A0ABX6FJ11_9BACL|nr:DUF3173 domain-containing protein [Gemella sanguinis]EGF88383.1 hypothetical protein HMPREF0433_00631 [Gemella sanguinis M325]QGS07362.1 DUF3173 domain-containing protein [Gemella sanguinis]